MKTTFIILFITALTHVRAQTVILERDVKDFSADSLITGKTFSGKKFSSPGIGGIAFPLTMSDAGVELNQIASIDFYNGYSLKYKFRRWLNGGITLAYDYRNYNLNQTNEKTFPDSIQNDKECFRFHSIDGGAFLRVVYANPLEGNGKFIDIGINGQYIFGSNHSTWNDGPDGTIIKIKERKLPYINNFQYYVMAQTGFSHFTLRLTYRLSDIFKSQYNYPEFSKVNIGIQWILGK